MRSGIASIPPHQGRHRAALWGRKGRDHHCQGRCGEPGYQAAIAATGSLEFRIVANARDHQYIIALAEEQAQSPDIDQRINRFVVNEYAEKLGCWVQAAKKSLKATEMGMCILRNSATGEMIALNPVPDKEQLLEDYLADNGLENVDILVDIDDGCDVTGDMLGTVAAACDEYMNPCVNFNLRRMCAKIPVVDQLQPP